MHQSVPKSQPSILHSPSKRHAEHLAFDIDRPARVPRTRNPGLDDQLDDSDFMRVDEDSRER